VNGKQQLARHAQPPRMPTEMFQEFRGLHVCRRCQELCGLGVRETASGSFVGQLGEGCSATGMASSHRPAGASRQSCDRAIGRSDRHLGRDPAAHRMDDHDRLGVSAPPGMTTCRGEVEAMSRRRPRRFDWPSPAVSSGPAATTRYWWPSAAITGSSGIVPPAPWR